MLCFVNSRRRSTVSKQFWRRGREREAANSAELVEREMVGV